MRLIGLLHRGPPSRCPDLVAQMQYFRCRFGFRSTFYADNCVTNDAVDCETFRDEKAPGDGAFSLKVMKRRFFFLGMIGAGAIVVLRIGRSPTPEQLASAEALAIDPDKERFIYIDGWITEVPE